MRGTVISRRSGDVRFLGQHAQVFAGPIGSRQASELRFEFRPTPRLGRQKPAQRPRAPRAENAQTSDQDSCHRPKTHRTLRRPPEALRLKSAQTNPVSPIED